MQIHNPILTGSFTVNGVDVSSITGSSSSSASFASQITSLNATSASILAQTASLNAFSSSLLSYTSSNDAKVSSLNLFSSSILSYTSSTDAKIASIYTTTGSQNTRLGALEAATASLYTATSSFNAFSASLNSYTSSTDAKIASIYSTTSSLNASVAGLNAQTASLLSYTSSNDAKIVSIYSTTSSLNTRVGTLEAYTSSLNAKTSSFATTGSNNFNGTQTITGSVLQSGSFTSTGTLTAQTLVVQTITSSVDFVTGSTRFGSLLDNTHVFSGSVTMNPGGLFVSSSGNVGIGTSTPSAKLHINGSTGASTYKGFAYTYAGSETLINEVLFQAVVGGYSSNLPMFLFKDERSDQGTTQRIFEIQGGRSGVGTILTTLASGNVGIGTTSPAYKLHVSAPNSASYFDGGTTDTSFYISHGGYVPGSQTIAGIRTNTGSPVFNAKNGGTIYFNRDVAAANVEFQYNSAGNTALFISGSGNVGIGTSSPDLTLTVNGAMNLRNSTRAGAFEIDSSGNLWTGTATTLGNIYFETGHSTTGLPSTGTPRMTITGGGNVLIGTTTDDTVNKLQVTGDIKVSAKLKVGSSQVSTNSTTTAITTAKTIYTRVGNGKSEFVFVMGDVGGAAYFADIVSFASGASVVVISSTTTYGSPSARTYSVSGDNLQLSMASGTAETQVFPISGS